MLLRNGENRKRAIASIKNKNYADGAFLNHLFFYYKKGVAMQ